MTVNTNGLKDQLQKTTQNKALTKKGESMEELLKKMSPQIAKALPKHMTADRMARIALTAFNGNKQLQQCDKMSFLAALMQSVQAGVEPNTVLGEAYLIPYGNKCQFQIGYKGILTLCFRSGEFESIYAHEVYANDEFSYAYGLHKDLKHIPAENPEGEPIYFYAVYHLKNGGYDFQVWSKDKVLTHARKFSKTFKSGPWQTNFNEMAKKTVLLQLLKYAPKSVEIAKAMAMDSTIKEDIKEDMTESDNIIENVDYSIETDEEIKVDKETGEVLEGQQTIL